MKSMLLITSCILLVIAFPVPREASFPHSHSDGDKVNGLSIGTGNSATLGPRGNPNRSPEPLSGVLSTLTLERRSSADNPHNNKPAHIPTELQSNIVPYSFGDTVEEIHITQKLGLPEPLPQLKTLPKEFSECNIHTLETMARDIHDQYKAVLGDIKDDRNKVLRARTFVLSEGKAEPITRREKTIEAPQWPAKGSGYQQALIKMIKDSDQELRQAVSHRNTALTKLLNIEHTRNIPDPHMPNEYVTYWKHPETWTMGSRTYFFGTTEYGDVTAKLGCYEKIPNIKKLPNGWRHFKPEELGRIAAGILAEDSSGTSRFSSIITKMMNDRNLINRAISSIQGFGRKPTRMGSISPELPSVDSTAENHTEQLIALISSAHHKLQDVVNDRNTRMTKLDALQFPLGSHRNADRTNPYVTEWEKRHRHVQTTPPSEPYATPGDSRSGDGTVQSATSRKTSLDAVAEVSSPKRPRTSSKKHNTITTGNIDPALFTVGPVRVVDNPGSPNQVKLGSAPGHPGGPEHNPHLPAMQSDTFPTSSSQHTPSSPEDTVDWGAFIDFGHHDA
ncbi:hypothetical protein H0H93_006619 [Arthromyces matolae]|nr:hypothetical protein H0H93_006619 [Arthromyces matolae]